MTTPNTPSNGHPDIRTDAPGRIPESLIDAAIDGELNEDMQREIAHALRYDPLRKQELLETADAINALQMPIIAPDFADLILDRTDRHRRFIPASWRRLVRTGRLGIAATLLLTLIAVAGLQRIYPRLTTLGSHPTPVLDLEVAMEQDTDRLASKVSSEVHTLRVSMAPMASFLETPGQTDQRFEITLASSPSRPADSIAGGSRDTRFALHIQHAALIGIAPGGGAMLLGFDATLPSFSFSRTQSPLRLLEAGGLHGWVSSVESPRARRGGHDSRVIRDADRADRTDVPDLP